MFCRTRIIYGVLLYVFLMSSAHSKTHHPQEFLKKISGAKDEGAQIVQHYCINCHAEKPLISLGAPRIGVASDWVLRLKQGRRLLLQHTDEGLNAMPPRGGCFECTDEQLILSVAEMLRPLNMPDITP